MIFITPANFEDELKTHPSKDKADKMILDILCSQGYEACVKLYKELYGGK